MEKTAQILDIIIEKYGFGCEFSKEELYDLFKDENLIESLTECGLIEKNQITNRYYLTDIFTCNTFLSKHLPKKENKKPEKITKKYSRTIKKSELKIFLHKFEGFEENIEKIMITSDNDNFEVEANMIFDSESFERFNREK